MADFTDENLWKELDQYFKLEQRQPGDLTIHDVMAKYGLSNETVRKKLSDLCARGDWVRVKVLDDGKVTWVYRKAVQDA